MLYIVKTDVVYCIMSQEKWMSVWEAVLLLLKKELSNPEPKDIDEMLEKEEDKVMYHIIGQKLSFFLSRKKKRFSMRGLIITIICVHFWNQFKNNWNYFTICFLGLIMLKQKRTRKYKKGLFKIFLYHNNRKIWLILNLTRRIIITVRLSLKTPWNSINKP